MSTAHLIILLIIVILVFGPSRLEGLGSSLGKAIRGFKKGMSEEENSQANKKQADKKTKKKKVS